MVYLRLSRQVIVQTLAIPNQIVCVHGWATRVGGIDQSDGPRLSDVFSALEAVEAAEKWRALGYNVVEVPVVKEE